MTFPPADDDERTPTVPLAAWPVPRRRDWAAWVNRPQTAAEEAAVRRAITHGRPLGSDAWATRVERRLGLPPLRPRGRPRKKPPDRR